MSTKVVSVPKDTIKVNDGEKVEKKNLFLTFVGQLIENYAQKNDTDAFLVHSIREKIDAHSGEETMELEEAEIELLEQAIKKLREGEFVRGSGWYYVVKTLREAVPKKRESKK